MKAKVLLRTMPNQRDSTALQRQKGTNLFAKGQGVAQDDVEALRLFRLAAAKGHEDAQYNANQLLLRGRGVARNHAEAARQNGCILFLHFSSGSCSACNSALSHLLRALRTDQLNIDVTPMTWTAFEAAPKVALDSSLFIVFYGAGRSGMDAPMPESLPVAIALHHMKNAKPFVGKKDAAKWQSVAGMGQIWRFTGHS
jgi:hypothetical protein